LSSGRRRLFGQVRLIGKEQREMPGLFFEDFVIGTVYRHEPSRTFTLADSIQYTCMCMDTEPAYLDEGWATAHGRNRRIEIHPLYALSMVLGAQATDLTFGTTLGNLGLFDVTFPTAVYPGDALRSQTTILGKRESRTKPDRGIVEFMHEGFNQNGEVVVRARRTGMLLKHSIVEPD
jgi:acyl dehydratase